MTDLPTLIEKYWAGVLNDEEKAMLIELLEERITDFSDEEYSAFISLLNNKATRRNKKDPGLKRNFRSVESKLGFTEEKAPVRSILRNKNWQWVAAAGVIGIVSFSTWLWTGKGKQTISKTEKPIAIESGKTRMDTITNSTDNAITRRLEDGTTVDLEANSTISFDIPFNSLTRDISLRGKAFFHVAKDTKRPFTVYANNVSTTATGTFFSVDAFDRSLVNVRLFEGGVVVKPVGSKKVMDPIHLSPGEELKINGSDLTYTKASFSVENDASNAAKVKDQRKNNNSPLNLDFNKTPLYKVFGLIEKKYNVHINYSKDELDNLSFTGSFLSSDSLKNILTILCNTNDLTLTLDDGTIIITR